MIELTVEMAEKCWKAALAKARELGTPMTVTVVDEAGRLVFSARANGAGLFTPDISRAKATAAAAFRRSTLEMVEQYKSNPTFWGAIPSVLAGQALPSTGGVPIVQKDRVIGAIGCSGGTSEQDHACAEAGAKAITQ